MNLLGYKAENGRSDTVEGNAPPSTLVFADGALHASVHWAVGHTDIGLHPECRLYATSESLSLSVSPSASRANEAGCVSYANSYKALYSFHTGQ